jgi:phosphoglycerate dehydrogenase-like enzyme
MSADAVVSVVDAGDGDPARLRRLEASVPTRIHTGAPDPDELVARAAGTRVLATLYTYTRVPAEVIDRLEGVELIITRTAGYSHIDVDAAARRGIAVAAVPDAPTVAVAEWTFGALLTARKHIAEAAADTRRGVFDYVGYHGSDLHGQTLGVVGLGRIGRRVAELGAAFGMPVLGWARRPMDVPGVEQVELDELLSRSDVISLNVALTPETDGLIGAAQLARCRPGAWIVNTARGEVLDTAALTAALRSGALGGACLDVLAGEPPSDAELTELAGVPNLLLTPHVSWHTEGTLERQFGGMTDTILAYCAGQEVAVVARG